MRGISRAKWGRYAQLLKCNREFRKIWIGQSVNFLGDSFYDIALMWYVYAVTGSATQSGLVLVFIFLPSIVFGIWFGPLIDRTNRKPWLVLTSALQAIAITGFGVLAVTGHFLLWAIYLISFLLATGEVAMGPAFTSAIPDLVSEELLVTANAMLSTTHQLFRLLGSIFGGVVIASVGMSSAFFIDAVSFAVAALYFAMTAIPLRTGDLGSSAGPGARGSIWADIKTGTKWLTSRRNLLMILIVATISNMGLAPTNVLPAMYLKKVMHAGPTALGIFDAAIGFGVVLGAVWLGTKSIKRIGLWFTSSIVMQGVGLGIVGVAPHIWVSMVGNFILGMAVSMAGIPLSTMFQALVPRDMRGRVSSITGAVASLSIPVTYGFVGILADGIGARWTYGWGAICLVLAGMAAFAMKTVRETRLTSHVSESAGPDVRLRRMQETYETTQGN
jgi:MFS transporter, DHA3 family, macrolide efflux protein